MEVKKRGRNRERWRQGVRVRERKNKKVAEEGKKEGGRRGGAESETKRKRRWSMTCIKRDQRHNIN